MKPLPHWIKPGAKVRINYSPNNQANQLLHVRGIVDGQFVTRRWVRHKARWAYEVHSPVRFQVLEQEGCLEKG